VRRCCGEVVLQQWPVCFHAVKELSALAGASAYREMCQALLSCTAGRAACWCPCMHGR
jgi:hypothetical protein